MDFVERFVTRLRERAGDPLLGGSAEARLVERIAEQLEAEYTAYLDEKLSTTQAAAESGFTPQGIRLLRRRGIIGDRRRDLPRKPGHGVVRSPRAIDPTPSIA